MQTKATIQSSFTGIAGTEGVYPDFSLGQAARMRNFRIDNLGRLRRRDGYRLLCECKDTVRGCCYGRLSAIRDPALYYCTATGIYSFEEGAGIHHKLHTVSIGEAWEEVTMFLLGGKLYLLGAGKYYRCDYHTIEEVQGYFPLRYRDLDPTTGAGKEAEAPNALTRMCLARYSPKTPSSIFLLPESAIAVEWVKVGGQFTSFQVEAGFYDAARLQVVLEITVPASQDAVELCYRDAREERRDKVLNNPHVYRYGGSDDLRLFFYGNEEAKIYYSADLSSHKDAPAYFPYDNCLQVGRGGNSVTGVVRRYDHLLIHTETETFAAQRKEEGYRLYLVEDKVGCAGYGKSFEIGKDSLTVCSSGVYRLKPQGNLGNRIAQRISEEIASQEGADVLCDAMTLCDPIRQEVWFVTRDLIWIYQYENKVWYQFDRPEAEAFLYCGGVCFRRGKRIYRYEGGLDTDLGEPILALWESGPISPAKARRPLREGAICCYSTLPEAQVCVQVTAFDGHAVTAQTAWEVSVPCLLGTHTLRAPLHLPCADGYCLALTTCDRVIVSGLGLRCGGQSWKEERE